MTINSTTRKAGPFSGTGLQTAYPFAFKVFVASDMLVVQTDASGAETTNTLTTDYTVALNADQNANPGGTVNMVNAPPAGHLLTIASAVPFTQGQSIPNTGGFYPKVVEDALDRLTIAVQQLYEQVSRAVKVSISSAVSPDDLLAAIADSVSATAESAAAAGMSENNAAGSKDAAAISASQAAATAASFNDANIVHKAGDEVIDGQKSFSTSPLVPEPVSADDSFKAATTSWVRKFIKAASETVAGIAKASTQALTDAGTDDATFITPKKLKTYINARTWQNLLPSRMSNSVQYFPD